jgi:hypothetical protein
MNIEKIATVAAQECIRQQVGLDRVAMLIEAYDTFMKADALDEGKTFPFSVKGMAWLARVIEPININGFRRVPVIFANGGSSCHPNEVQCSIVRHFGRLKDANTSDSGFNDAWVKHFLWIHPLIDGNGRVAWIIYNWLNGTLDDPENLPDYFG